MARLMGGQHFQLCRGHLRPVDPLGQGSFDVFRRRFVLAVLADADAGDGPAQGVEVVAAEGVPVGVM